MARAQLVPGWSWQLSSEEGTAAHQGAVGRGRGRCGRIPAPPRPSPLLELSLPRAPRQGRQDPTGKVQRPQGRQIPRDQDLEEALTSPQRPEHP